MGAACARSELDERGKHGSDDGVPSADGVDHLNHGCTHLNFAVAGDDGKPGRPARDDDGAHSRPE